MTNLRADTASHGEEVQNMDANIQVHFRHHEVYVLGWITGCHILPVVKSTSSGCILCLRLGYVSQEVLRPRDNSWNKPIPY